jgi:Na+-driven multidrug efflux pump
MIFFCYSTIVQFPIQIRNLFLLPAKFGLLGLCLAQPAADAVTFLFAWIIKKTRIKKESRKEKGIA